MKRRWLIYCIVLFISACSENVENKKNIYFRCTNGENSWNFIFIRECKLKCVL